MATFDAVGGGKANNLIHCFLVYLISFLLLIIFHSFKLSSVLIFTKINLWSPNKYRMELGAQSKEVLQWSETSKMFAFIPISRSWMIYASMILQTESPMRLGQLLSSFILYCLVYSLSESSFQSNTYILNTFNPSFNLVIAGKSKDLSLWFGLTFISHGWYVVISYWIFYYLK